MKISQVNIYNFKTPWGGGSSAQNSISRQFDYTNTLNPADALGRSQVNFEGRKNKDKKYQRYDQMFIDTVTQNLRLSKEDKARLTANINDFLKANGFKSLEAIAGNKNNELQADFISELGDDICQSDFDYNILADAFQERMYYKGQYQPKVDLYEKDYEIVDHILDKYGMNEAQKADIFDEMKEHAEYLGGETLFDLFKPGNKPSALMNIIRNNLGLDKNLTDDLLIDFGLMAKKNNEARYEGIYPWKMTLLMNQQARDEAIACDIIGEYDLEGDEFWEGNIDDESYDDDDDDDDANDCPKPHNPYDTMHEIAKHLNKRRAGVSVEQISFELMEKYNLPSEAYDFIKDTIYEYDADDFMDD